MESALLGIVLGFIFKGSKYIIIFSILFALFAIVKNKKYKYSVLIFIGFFLLVVFQLVNTSDLPENISARGLVTDNFVSDKNKYIVKIGRGTNVILHSTNEFKIGDEIKFNAKLTKPLGKMNSTDFDYKSYLNSKKIYATAFSTNEKIVGRNNLFYMRELLKNHVVDTFKPLSEKNGDFLSAVLLSDTDYLDESRLIDYRELGISHILAISGFHIALILLIFESALKIIRVGKIPRRIIALTITFIYIWLVGMPISAIRAFVMATCQFFAFLLQKKYNNIKALELSAIIILALSPYSLLSASFWLSFTATLGVIIFIKYRYLLKGSKIKESIGLSLIVFLMISPLTAFYFYEIMPISILSNILLVPIYSLAIILGLLCIVFPIGVIVFPSLELVLNLAGLISGKLNFGFVINVQKPSMVFLLIYYLIVILIVMRVRIIRKDINRFIFVSLIMIAVFQSFVILQEYNTLTLTSLYVGQGDSTLIRYKGKNYMIDTSGSIQSFRPGKYYVLNYLKAKGINKIDKLFISHFDEDHVDGVLDLVKEINIRESYLPFYEDNIYTRELAKVSKIFVLNKNATINTNGISFTNINDFRKYREDNDNSMVLLMEYQNFKGLFTGDSSNVDNLKQKLDYLKVSHHGSKNSTNEVFLKNTLPEFATISAGVNNKYGHPDKFVTDMLKQFNVNYKVTKEDGEINYFVNSKEIRTYKEPTDNHIGIFIMELLIWFVIIYINKKELEERNEISRY